MDSICALPPSRCSTMIVSERWPLGASAMVNPGSPSSVQLARESDPTIRQLVPWVDEVRASLTWTRSMLLKMLRAYRKLPRIATTSSTATPSRTRRQRTRRNHGRSSGGRGGGAVRGGKSPGPRGWDRREGGAGRGGALVPPERAPPLGAGMKTRRGSAAEDRSGSEKRSVTRRPSLAMPSAEAVASRLVAHPGLVEGGHLPHDAGGGLDQRDGQRRPRALAQAQVQVDERHQV